jgi:hypothetical protein
LSGAREARITALAHEEDHMFDFPTICERLNALADTLYGHDISGTPTRGDETANDAIDAARRVEKALAQIA